jgi:PAS domain S-box-containing protein
MGTNPKQMRHFWELSLDILCIVDFNNRFQDVSPAFERVLGYSKEEVAGRSFTDFLHPDDVSATLAEASLHPGGHIARHFENRYRCQDGSYKWLSWNAVPVHEEGLVYATARDITWRKNMEEEFRETRDYLNNLLDYANAPIIVWDPGLRITQFNHAFERLTGRLASAAIGQGIDILFPDDKRKESIDFISRTMKGEHWEVVEIPILRSDGTVRTVLWNSANIYSSDNKKLIATIAQGQDITERKQTEQDLLRNTILVDAINRIFREYLTNASMEELVTFCLKVAKELTQSQFGFIGEVGTDGLLHDIALSTPGWESRPMLDEDGHRTLLGNFDIPGLYNTVITGNSLRINYFPTHPGSTEIPPGHPPINNFLGIPLNYAGKTISILALANREGGYRNEDEEVAEAIAPAIIEAMMRKQVEEALKENEARFRSLTENIPSVFMRYDKNLRVVYLSPQSEAITGIPIKDFIGRTNREVGMPEHLCNLWENAIREVFQTVQNKDIEFDITTGQGKKTFYLKLSPELNSEGRVVNVLGISTDITERNQALEKIKESETRYRNILESITDAFVSIDRQWRYTYANETATKILYKSREELLGKVVWEVFPDSPEVFNNGIHQAMSKNILTSFETFYPVVNTWYECHCYPSQQGLNIFFSDITSRKQAETSLQKYAKELETANQEMEAFNYSASHDLRQPLRAMEGFSELLIEEYRDKLDATGKDYLDRIRKAGQYLSELIDDMLKLSRATRAEMFRGKVDLSETAQLILEELRSQHPERKVEIKIPPGIIAEGDKPLLTIALRNLVENAWKFTVKNPQALIEMGEMIQGEKRVYFIRDNGIGFDMQYIDKLFHPFSRLHTDKEYPGTGIGLAIVQRIIRRHGGKIWAESALNKGATFYFTLD